MNTGPFYQTLPKKLHLSGSDVESILLREYGGIFATSATPPDRVIFADEDDVRRFQASLDVTDAEIGGYAMTLQETAISKLLAAIAEANADDLSITPRAADSAARTYADTIELWASRVNPALDHWSAQGRIDLEEAERIRSLSPFAQVTEVFRHEADEIWFAKDLSKSIIYSVAPPGASQHLSLLAFDVTEFDQKPVREILARHGWYQTVVSDLPHFTYLGRGRDELPGFGLKLVEYNEQEFWVPDI
jgi:hypothetical protein